MSPITITVEPVALPAGRVTERAHPQGAAGVEIVAAPEQGHGHAPDLIEPVVGFRNWRILRTGPALGELSSPYFPVAWSEPVIRAECRRWRTPEALLDTPHVAPQSECGCGIRAYHTPTGEFSKVDYRAVSGIVTVWGRIEIGADEMRAELARVEALALYSRWSRRQRMPCKTSRPTSASRSSTFASRRGGRGLRLPAAGFAPRGSPTGGHPGPLRRAVQVARGRLGSAPATRRRPEGRSVRSSEKNRRVPGRECRVVCQPSIAFARKA